MAKEEDAQRIAKNYVRRLARDITVRQAILTGSRATGSYLEDSDVDLVIVSDDFSKMQLPERLRYLQKQWKSKIPPGSIRVHHQRVPFPPAKKYLRQGGSADWNSAAGFAGAGRILAWTVMAGSLF